MSKINKHIMLVMLLVNVAIIPFPVFALEDNCDTEVERQVISLQVTVGTFAQSDETTSFQVSCTEFTETIRSCALIGVSDEPVQTFCFPEDGKPSYTEEYYILKYYDVAEP